MRSLLAQTTFHCIDYYYWFKLWFPCLPSFGQAFFMVSSPCGRLSLWFSDTTFLPYVSSLEQLTCSNRNSVCWFWLGLLPLRLSGFEIMIVWLITHQFNLDYPPYNLLVLCLLSFPPLPNFLEASVSDGQLCQEAMYRNIVQSAHRYHPKDRSRQIYVFRSRTHSFSFPSPFSLLPLTENTRQKMWKSEG